jgi:hypothetical protein
LFFFARKIYFHLAEQAQPSLRTWTTSIANTQASTQAQWHHLEDFVSLHCFFALFGP